MVQTTKIYFPISLQSALKEAQINEHIFIKRIDDEDCQYVLGIKNVQFEFDNNGCMTKTSYYPDHEMWFKLFMPDFHDPNLRNLMRLNFVLIADSREDAIAFQQALKLLNHEIFTGVNLGFSRKSDGHTKYYIHPKLYSGRIHFKLTDTSLERLRHLIQAITNLRQDDKLSIILGKYLYALSSDGLSTAHRFLDLAIIMEMLLLPKSTQELSYKFRLRFANLFKKAATIYSNNDIHDLYSIGKTIYTTRSKIVHNGTADGLRDNLEQLKNFTQQAILLYINDRNFFHEDNLDKLCL
ncbi:MAG: hypothetical protein WC581_09500 [Thermodesulfovibrionales bacterium]